MTFTQEIADKLKTQPIDVQARTLMEYLDSEPDMEKADKNAYLQFEDLLRDIRVANRKIEGNISGDFFQLRVDEVMRMRGLKK